MKNIIHSICACNKKFHEKTRHPLVSIINLAYEQEDIQLEMGSYAVILRQIDADSYCYGRKKYDFSAGVKNPYAERLKKQITIRLDAQTIDYFKEMSLEQNIPYQNLIDLYLKDCVKNKRKLDISFI